MLVKNGPQIFKNIMGILENAIKAVPSITGASGGMSVALALATEVSFTGAEATALINEIGVAATGIVFAAGIATGTGKDIANAVKGDSETKAEDINWKGFNGKKDPETGLSKLQGHYQKHVVEGGEFGDISQNECLKMAKDFAKESNAGFQEQQIGNLTVKYDPETRRMFIGNLKDREIRTFYRADYRSADPFAAAVEEAIKMINQ